jgi:glycosyltransferase involved in cell wall biosynthesis
MKYPHILMVTHVLPYPHAAGNEIRIFRLLKFLRKVGFHITLVLRPLEKNEISNESIIGLDGLVDAVYIFDSRDLATKENLKFPYLDLAEGDSRLKEMQDGFCPPWFAAEIESLIADIKPDVVIAQYIFMSRILLAPNLKHVLKIIDTHDLFSNKQEVVDKYRIENFGLIMTEEEEALFLRRADVLMAIQQSEYEQIITMVPDRQVVLTGFDMDIAKVDFDLQVPHTVLIVASSNEFNVRGTQDFIDFIWPLIRERIPVAHLRIVGKVCNHVNTADSSIEKIGFIHDLSDEYERACVVVNPCAVGTGLKIKTIEALAWGKAHVGWPASSDGIVSTLDLPYLVAKDVVEFADAVSNLLVNVDKAKKLGQAAYKFAELYLGGESTYEPLVSLIQAHCTSLNKGVKKYD